MSITYNFEERAWVTRDNGVYEWDQEEVQKLLDHARQLEADNGKLERAIEGLHQLCLHATFEISRLAQNDHDDAIEEAISCQLAKLLGEE